MGSVTPDMELQRAIDRLNAAMDIVDGCVRSVSISTGLLRLSTSGSNQDFRGMMQDARNNLNVASTQMAEVVNAYDRICYLNNVRPRSDPLLQVRRRTVKVYFSDDLVGLEVSSACSFVRF
jgi:hypothetical protein